MNIEPWVGITIGAWLVNAGSLIAFYHMYGSRAEKHISEMNELYMIRARAHDKDKEYIELLSAKLEFLLSERIAE